MVAAHMALAVACGESAMRTLPDLDEEASPGDPRLAACEIEALDGVAAGLCGTLVVPERRGDNAGATLAIPIQRIRASTPAVDALPIAYLGNGPGQSNFQFRPPRALAQGNDVLRMGYRGTDSSVTLQCDEVASVIRAVPALTENHLDEVRRAASDCIARLADSGHRLSDFGVDAVADDLAATLDVFEYERVHLLADGFGIQTAFAFAERYPERIGRLVVTSPAPLGPFLLSARELDDHLEALAGRCAQSSHCSQTTDDLIAALRTPRDQLPHRWAFTSIDSGRISLVTAMSLLGQESTARAIDAWTAASQGSNAGLAMMSWLGDSVGQNLFIWGDALAKAMPLGFDPEHDYRASEKRGPSVLGSPARLLLFGAAPDSDTPAQVDLNQAPETLSAETLLVYGSLDPTRAVASRAFASRLENVRDLTIGEAVLASEAWLARPREMAGMVAEFLNGGEPATDSVTKMPWSFEPTLRMSTMQWFMTILTIVIPVVLFAFIALMLRRLRRTIELERAEHAAERDG